VIFLKKVICLNREYLKSKFLINRRRVKNLEIDCTQHASACEDKSKDAFWKMLGYHFVESLPTVGAAALSEAVPVAGLAIGTVLLGSLGYLAFQKSKVIV
jgi:hypothetical protein